VKDPYNYKLGTAFMLAHDYGFKRVMSSYYFSNTDQVIYKYIVALHVRIILKF
jgi:hypothetical protein